MKRGGSRGELLHESVTGFLCDTDDDFVKAIDLLHTIKSDDCIAFAKRFDVATMVQQYDQLYETLLEN